MFGKKEDKSTQTFWQEYEENTGEKVLERGLGMYIGGWDEFDEKKLKGIWGLVVTTSGGFRFHHFPKNSWFENLTNFSGAKQQNEKTFFITQEKIISCEIKKETKWWKKIFGSSAPVLVIRYFDDTQKERQLFFETLAFVKHG